MVFLVHLVEAWDAYHDLVQEMVLAHDFEPIVISVPRRFNGESGLGHEGATHLALENLGVAHIRFTAADVEHMLPLLKTLEPDLIFRQSQWDADIPEQLGCEHLGFARTCLVPYETMNIVDNLRDGRGTDSAVDSPFHRGSWAVFCANDLALELCVPCGRLAGRQFHAVGHPKADRLRVPLKPWWPVPGAEDRPAIRGRIVWTAHHSIGSGWDGLLGSFRRSGSEILDGAGEHPDLDFVLYAPPGVRPVP